MPALIVATLIAFSRLYVGVHYPFDVIAGVLTGTIYAVITVAIYRKFFKDKKHSENKRHLTGGFDRSFLLLYHQILLKIKWKYAII